MTHDIIAELDGDLFDAPRTASLCHCVSADFRMGAGIAKQFRARFGNQEALLAQRCGIGDVAVLADGHRFVFYLVTKERYFHKPGYDAMQSTLLRLRDMALERGVAHLAMPRLGCGLDRLAWPRVRDMIATAFDGSGISISVYNGRKP